MLNTATIEAMLYTATFEAMLYTVTFEAMLYTATFVAMLYTATFEAMLTHCTSLPYTGSEHRFYPRLYLRQASMRSLRELIEPRPLGRSRQPTSQRAVQEIVYPSLFISKS